MQQSRFSHSTAFRISIRSVVATLEMPWMIGTGQTMMLHSRSLGTCLARGCLAAAFPIFCPSATGCQLFLLLWQALISDLWRQPQ